MNKIWVISDTHFNHKTMIKENWRQFLSIDDMNNKIILNWNKLISDEDIVYHLGDVCIGQKTKFMGNILPRLKGKIIFIRGNHDSKSLTNVKNLIIDYKCKLIELVHNPAEATNSTDYIIHGHQHKSGTRHFCTKDINIKYFNANLEYNRMKPFLLSEIMGSLNKDVAHDKDVKEKKK